MAESQLYHIDNALHLPFSQGCLQSLKPQAP